MLKILFYVVDELEKVEIQQGIDLKKIYFLKIYLVCFIDRKGRIKNSVWYY